MEIVRALVPRGVRRTSIACATHGIPVRGSMTGRGRPLPGARPLRIPVPLPLEKRIPPDHDALVAPLIGEASDVSPRGESVGALFSSEASLTQEMILWEDGVEQTLDSRTGTHPPEHLDTRHDPDHPAELAGPAPAPACRRPMTLQLHQPDGEGGLTPRTGVPRTGACSSARRAGTPAGWRTGR